MAHSDALIFLTNITWIFLLFLFTYFFFVCLVLPTFYKKFRARVLIKNMNVLSSLLAIRNLFAASSGFGDIARNSLLVSAVSVKSVAFAFKSGAWKPLAIKSVSAAKGLYRRALVAQFVRKYSLDLLVANKHANGVQFTFFNNKDTRSDNRAAFSEIQALASKLGLADFKTL